MVCYYNQMVKVPTTTALLAQIFLFAYLTHSLPVWYIWFHDYIDIPSGQECSNKIGSNVQLVTLTSLQDPSFRVDIRNVIQQNNLIVILAMALSILYSVFFPLCGNFGIVMVLATSSAHCSHWKMTSIDRHWKWAKECSLHISQALYLQTLELPCCGAEI